MHPRIPLAFLAVRAHCWLMVNLSSTSTPRSLSAELLSSKSAPSLYWCLPGVVPPQVQDPALALVELHQVSHLIYRQLSCCLLTFKINGLTTSRAKIGVQKFLAPNNNSWCYFWENLNFNNYRIRSQYELYPKHTQNLTETMCIGMNHSSF